MEDYSRKDGTLEIGPVDRKSTAKTGGMHFCVAATHAEDIKPTAHTGGMHFCVVLRGSTGPISRVPFLDLITSESNYCSFRKS